MKYNSNSSWRTAPKVPKESHPSFVLAHKSSQSYSAKKIRHSHHRPRRETETSKSKKRKNEYQFESGEGLVDVKYKPEFLQECEEVGPGAVELLNLARIMDQIGIEEANGVLEAPNLLATLEDLSIKVLQLPLRLEER